MSPNKYPGIIFISASFVMSWGIIGVTVWRGESGNTLHSSAQSWSFVVVLATLAGYGLGSITEIVSAMKGPNVPQQPSPPPAA